MPLRQRWPGREQAAQEQQVGSRIGLLVCIAAKGKEKLEADLTLNAVGSTALEDGKVDVGFSYTIENKGNIHISPRGFVRVKKKESTMAEADVGIIQGLYTEEKRNYQTSLQASLPPGKYTAELDIKMISYGKEKRMRKTQEISVSEAKT